MGKNEVDVISIVVPGKVERARNSFSYYLSEHVSQVYTKEDISLLQKYFDDMSDDVFLQLVKTRIHEPDNHIFRDFCAFVMNKQQENDFTERCWNTEVGMDMASDAAITIIMNNLAQLVPTKQVHVYSNVVDALAQHCMNVDSEVFQTHVPSDLFLKGEVRGADDMELCIHTEKDGRDYSRMVRVYVVHDYYDQIQSSSGNDVVTVGYISIPTASNRDSGLFVKFGVIPGLDCMVVDSYPNTYGMTDDDRATVCKTFTDGDIIQLVSMHLKMWYVVQKAMLDEQLSVLFLNGKMEKDHRKRMFGRKLLKPFRVPVYRIREEDVKNMTKKG